jgi:hypothetical protein
MRRIGLRNCPYCGSLEVYLSAPKTFWEKIPVVLLLRLVRCHSLGIVFPREAQLY